MQPRSLEVITFASWRLPKASTLLHCHLLWTKPNWPNTDFSKSPQNWALHYDTNLIFPKPHGFMPQVKLGTLAPPTSAAATRSLTTSEGTGRNQHQRESMAGEVAVVTEVEGPECGWYRGTLPTATVIHMCPSQELFMATFSWHSLLFGKCYIIALHYKHCITLLRHCIINLH